jgi:hypothetical protein
MLPVKRAGNLMLLIKYRNMFKCIRYGNKQVGRVSLINM